VELEQVDGGLPARPAAAHALAEVGRRGLAGAHLAQRAQHLARAVRERCAQPLRANLTEALEMRRKLTTPQNVVQSLNFLSMVAYQSGDPDAARDYYHEAFEIAGELETPAVQFDILFDLAQLLQAKKPVIAAEILAFLDARQDAAIWTKNLDEIWSELREKLNESVIAVVRQRAQQFDLEQIAARALDAL
jgi:hypothetical protein